MCHYKSCILMMMMMTNSIVTCSSLTHFNYNTLSIFTLLSRLFDRVDLIKPDSNKCQSMHPSVRPSAPKKVSSILMQFGMWLEVDEWCTTVCSMIQGQGHELFKVGNLAAFKSYLIHHLLELVTDHGFLTQGTMSKFVPAVFLYFF